MQSNRLKILYIAGWGRSGSTLLDNILGQLDRFVSIGELRYVWDRGLQQNQRCGCGAAFRQCSFWRDTFQEAFGGFDRVEPDEMLAAREKFDHARMVLLRSRLASPQMERYQAALVKLYRAVSAISGADVVVDSSKTPSHGRILQGCPDLNVYVVHLVRDSRAVAFSWQRKRLTRDVEGAYMTRFTPARSALLWDGMNWAAEMLGATDRTRFLRVRYEDLVTSPQTTLEAILGKLGTKGVQMPFLNDRNVELEPLHGFSGNPSRFDRGQVELRLDDEWRSQLKLVPSLLVTGLTGLLLRRYGYPLFSSHRRQGRVRDAGEANDPLALDA